MKKQINLLSMTAAVALLSTPALAHQTKKVDLNNDGRIDATVKYSNSKSTFHRLDANHDGRVSMEEFQDNTMHDNEAGVFKMIDQDQSGYITRAELANNSKTGGQPVRSTKTVSNLKSKSGAPVGSMDEKYYNNTIYIDNPFYDDPELRNDVDIDIDNPFVDDPELKNDVNWDVFRRIDKRKPLFPQIDANNNGSISQREFQSASLLENESEVFAMLDKNQNGAISRYEFKNYEKTGGRK